MCIHAELRYVLTSLPKVQLFAVHTCAAKPKDEVNTLEMLPHVVRTTSSIICSQIENMVLWHCTFGRDKSGRFTQQAPLQLFGHEIARLASCSIVRFNRKFMRYSNNMGGLAK